MRPPQPRPRERGLGRRRQLEGRVAGPLGLARPPAAQERLRDIGLQGRDVAAVPQGAGPDAEGVLVQTLGELLLGRLALRGVDGAGVGVCCGTLRSSGLGGHAEHSRCLDRPQASFIIYLDGLLVFGMANSCALGRLPCFLMNKTRLINPSKAPRKYIIQQSYARRNLEGPSDRRVVHQYTTLRRGTPQVSAERLSVTDF